VFDGQRARALATLAGAVALVLIVVAFYVPTIANPGFFNHDEWQRYDHLVRYGFLDYALQYGRILAGPDFGYPVRPLGFLQQGVSSIWMGTRPFVPHLIDVLHHATVALLFAAVLLRSGLPRTSALGCVLLFVVSPLATVSTGWVGASFDRWYAAFFLVAAYGAVSLARGLGRPGLNLVYVGAGTVLGLLSKETAVVLPGALCLAWFAARRSGGGGQRAGERWPFIGAAMVAGVAAIPLLAYLAVRAPAIVASMHGQGGAYAPSPGNVPANLAMYIAQPFLPGAVELESARWLPASLIAAAFALHAMVWAAFWRRYGAVNALLVCAAYFVLLLPVLPLHFAGAHYLYASGIPFSIMVGLLLFPVGAPAPHPAARAAMVGVFALLAVRSLDIQVVMYDYGVCENRFLNTYLPQARAARAQGADQVQVSVDADAMGYVAQRALFGRERFSAGGEIPTVVGGPDVPGAARLRMGADCRAREE
jgi:hypothetical protein